MSDRQFCSNLARDSAQEPLLGSAHTVKGYILVTCPKRDWAKQQYKSKGRSADLLNKLHTLQIERGYYTRLITQEDYDHGKITLFIMPDAVTISVENDAAALAAITTYFEEQPHNWQPYNGHMLLCCTNGMRDRCCAKFGFAVVRQANLLRDQGKHNLDVWQSTHLTGDRFAATALVLPIGDMYGWLRAENIEYLLDNLMSGTHALDLFRGNSYLPEPLQIASVLLKNDLKSAGFAGTENLNFSAIETDKNKMTVSVRHNGLEIATACLQKNEYASFADCDELDEEKKGHFSRWVAAG